MVSNLPRYQRDVDGLVLPVGVARQPALDFCNTLAGWNSPEQHEYLASYAHLVVWARETGLVDAASAAGLLASADLDPDAAGRELERARVLRHALYTACTDPANRVAWETVARRARSAAAHAVLSPDESPGHRWSVSSATGLARPTLELAREAADLLATIDLRHVKDCPGKGCGWLFVDPHGRRRWCSMAVCGNRAKVRRHAQRTRPGSRVDRAGR